MKQVSPPLSLRAGLQPRRIAMRSTLMALEPRMLFDGALAVSADSGLGETDTLAHAFSAEKTDAANLPIVMTIEPPAIHVGNDKENVPVDGTLALNNPPIRVSDPDGPGGDGTMDGYDIFLNVQHGTLTVGDAAGSIIYGNGSGEVKIWGTLEQMNAALVSLRYQPDTGYTGEDTLAMTVYASDRLSDDDQILICVNAPEAPNQAPHANADLRVVGEGRDPVNGNVLTGEADGDVADTDPEGDPIFVHGVVAGNTAQVPAGQGVGQVIAGQFGTLVIRGNGAYTYEPGPEAELLAPGQTIDDVFSYLVCDEKGEASTTLTIRMVGAPDVVAQPPSPGPEPVPVPPPSVPPGVSVPPVQSDVAPLPPVGEAVGPVDQANPEAGASVGSDATPPFTLLDPDSSRFSQISTRSDSFSPFAPAIVLGMLEESEKVSKAAKAVVAADDDCLPVPKEKPKVVKRNSALGDVKLKPKAFTEQVDDASKRVKPVVKPRMVRGKIC